MYTHNNRKKEPEEEREETEEYEQVELKIPTDIDLHEDNPAESDISQENSEVIAKPDSMNENDENTGISAGEMVLKVL